MWAPLDQEPLKTSRKTQLSKFVPMDKPETAITFPLPARRKISVETTKTSPNPIFTLHQLEITKETQILFFTLVYFMTVDCGDVNFFFFKICKCDELTVRLHENPDFPADLHRTLALFDQQRSNMAC